jgi:hypothetical protein
MQLESGRPPAGGAPRGHSQDWFDKTAACWEDVLYDQRLILEGYKLRFALDFKDLHDYLRPWGSPRKHDEPPLTESILATAWLTYKIKEKKKLRKPTLLPEYLKEYVHHFARTAVTGVWDEWTAVQTNVLRLERQHPIIRQAGAVDDADSGAWLDEHPNELSELLRNEFDTLVKLALSSRYLHSRGEGIPDWWSILDQFEDPDEFKRYWTNIGKGEQYERLHEPIHQFVLALFEEKREDPSVRLEDLERSGRHDARALQRVIQLNAGLRAAGDKEVVYLLTSSKRFWTIYENNEVFRDECRISWPHPASRPPTRVLRHPFCIVLFLKHWPAGRATDDDEARREVVKTLEGLQSEVHVYSSFVRQSRALQHEGLAGGQVDELRRRYDDAVKKLGSWSNLALALQQNQLLPVSLGRQIARDAVAFLRYVGRSEFPEFRRMLEAKRDEEYEGLIRVVFWLIEHCVTRIVDAPFIARSIGQVSAFPYLLKFEDQRIADAICRLRQARAVWRSEGKKQIQVVLAAVREALLSLVRLLGPSAEPRLQFGDAAILGGSLLLVFDQYDEARRFLRASFLREGAARNEWKYLRVLLDYRRLMASAPASVDEYSEVLNRVPEAVAEKDDRVRNQQLVLKTCVLVRRPDRPTRGDAEDVLSAFDQLATAVKSRKRLFWGASHTDASQQDELSYCVWNNYVYALLELADRLKVDDWILRAHKLANEHLELKGGDYPTEVKHTLAKVAYCYAMTLPSGSEERRASLRESRKRFRAVAQEMEFLAIPGPGPLQTLEQDRALVEAACEEEGIPEE